MLEWWSLFQNLHITYNHLVYFNIIFTVIQGKEDRTAIMNNSHHINP